MRTSPNVIFPSRQRRHFIRFFHFPKRAWQIHSGNERVSGACGAASTGSKQVLCFVGRRYTTGKLLRESDAYRWRILAGVRIQMNVCNVTGDLLYSTWRYEFTVAVPARCLRRRLWHLRISNRNSGSLVGTRLCARVCGSVAFCVSCTCNE